MEWGNFNDDTPVALTEVERDIHERIGENTLNSYSAGVMSNIYRAGAMLRNHMEREVLGEYGLSFTAFIVMVTLWVWGDMESQWLAGKAGVTKGTLTGVVKTLERRGLCQRVGHAQDKRKVIVSLTDEGRTAIAKIVPHYNEEETRLVMGLNQESQVLVAASLRTILATGSRLKMESRDPSQRS